MTKSGQAPADVHACDTCGGNGHANFDDVPGYRSVCPVCNGRARFSDRMPVADALADAETLRIYWHQSHSTAVLVDDEATAAAISTADLDDCAEDHAFFAARAAFRAVPELRGE